MKKDMVQAFTARVAQASRSELVVIMYEIILEDIKSARSNYEEDRLNQYVKDLKHGQRILNELMATLDYRYALSAQLMSLYIFINKSLVTAMMQKKVELLKDIEEILMTLKKGFEGICKEDMSGPVMQNTQQVYAGLTYGKGILNEVNLNANEQSRGYKA
ncbi:MAG: Flagellar protein FliS [Lachnoclostridium sp.]|jgi:flagellar secretion chaperone FliS